MSTEKKLVYGAVAIVIVFVATMFGSSSKDGFLNTGASLTVHNTPEAYTQGLDLGDGYIEFSKSGIIGPGANQGSWHNTLGRTVYINPSQVAIGFTSGTASTSMKYYAATSSTATFASDTAAPSSILAINATVVATSTVGPAFVVGQTSTGSGIPVTDGQYFVFQLQQVNASPVGETATSTNRGISNFFWRLKGAYKP